MSLTDIAIQKLKPREKPFKVFDTEGLFLLITPNGNKWWRLKYHFNGKEKLLSLGVYPHISLKEARDRRDQERKKLAHKIDPAATRKAEKAAWADGQANTFEVVAREWIAERASIWTPSNTTKTTRRLETDAFPRFGNRPIAEITAPELLAALRRTQARGALGTAHRVLQTCGQVFRYAIATGRAMRDPAADLRGALLSLNRSSVYYAPRPESDLNERLMRRLDELYTAHPFLGYRKLRKLLEREGHAVNGKRVLRLLRLLGLQAIVPKPNTSAPHPKHPIYPYLLKNLAITGPCQVWATDITYIRLGRGYCYLVAVIDWYSRYVVSWRLSATMESDFCVEALRCSLTHGTPNIFNTDQGSQFTSFAFTDVLKEAGVRISMDGRASYQDNIFTERFWRSVKYEEVYIKDYATIEDAHAGLAGYIAYYNAQRPHQALAYQTPEQVHFALAPNPPVDMMDNASALPTSPQAQQPQQPRIAKAA